MPQAKGSTWNRWDLHVHTPESFHQDFGEDSWDQYIDELEDVTDIPCLGITDYFSIDGYERVLEEKEDGRLDNFDLILPNIELRIDNVVIERPDDESESPSGANSVNLHVIFSNNLSPRDIRENFLHQIRADLPNSDDMPLTRENLERVGERDDLDHLDDDPSGDPFKKGCERVNIKHDSVYAALQNELFEGKYIVVVDTDPLDDMPWAARAGSLRATIVSKVDALFTANENARDFYLGKLPDVTTEEITTTFGRRKPCIRGSDAHDFESLCSPHDDRHCWIKADTTFEGLKQIIYEPEDRVRIQEENPLGHVSNRTPTSVEFRNGDIIDRLEVADTEIPLNPNLVTVIGGKGAGKTAFLDLIANCYEDRCIRDTDEEMDENSFVQRIEDLDPDIVTELSFFDDDIESFQKQVDDEDLIRHSELEYLPQGKIAEYCRDEDRLHDQVLKLIKQSVRMSDPELLERFENSREEMSGIEEELASITNRIHEHDPETLLSRLEDARTQVQMSEGDLEDIEDEINEFRERHGSEISEEAVTELQEQIDELDEELGELESVDSSIQTQIERLHEVELFNEDIGQLSDRLVDLGFDYTFEPLECQERIRELKELHDEIQARIVNLEGRKADVRNELSELRDLDEGISDLMNERREIESEIETNRQRVRELESRRDELESLRSDRRQKFYDYVDRVSNLEDTYNMVINEFSEDQDEILDDVTFEATINTKDGIVSDIYNHLDGRRVNFPEIQPIEDRLLSAIESAARREEIIDECIELAEQQREYLTENSNPAEFERDIYSGHFKLNEEIYFDGSEMEALSLGQKGTVLLKILLAQDRYPLIIDQPEENLDNKFIYRSLKDAFKNAKTNRQVIIATHNANLVVNTDAEQVIVAEYEDNAIEFTPGALENPDVRNRVTTILEGGERAFKEREEKYGFN